MRIVLEQPALQKVLARVAGAVETRSTIPIILNVLIEAGEGVARFAATDLDLEAAAEVEAEAEPGKVGAITVPARTLSEIVRAAPPGAEIAITFDPGQDARCQVAFGRSRYQLPVLPAGDFPRMPDFRPDWSVDLAGADLAMLIDQTEHAQSNEATRYYLNGTYVQMVAEDGRQLLRLVSTNGHLLALSQIDHGAPTGAGAIVPRKTMAEFRRLVDGVGGVNLAFSGGLCRLEVPGARIVSKVIDGAFPDYCRVIPRRDDPQGRPLRVDRELLLAAVRRVGLVSNDRSRPVRLSFAPGRLGLLCRNDQAAMAEEELGADYDGPAFDVGFNAGYLAAVLARLDSPTVTLRGADPGSPFRVDPVLGAEPPTGDVFAIVMPLRV